MSEEEAAPVPAGYAPPQPIGLGGWLLLPTLGFIATAIFVIWDLVDLSSNWNVLFAVVTESGSIASGLKMAFTAIVVLEVATVISALACIVLLVFCKRSLIWTASLHYVLIVVLGFAGLWLHYIGQQMAPDGYPNPSAIRGAFSAIVIALIWIPYFHLSLRVRNTCTR